jgi:hypothetical protein
MKRVLFILAVTFFGLFASFVDAYWGLLLYAWYSFASPLELTFGMLQGARFSLLVGIALVVTTLYQYRKIAVGHLLTYAIFSFLAVAFCSLAVQMKFGLSTIASQVELVSKLMVMCALAPVLLNSVEKLRGYVLVIALSGGLLGSYYGVFGLFAGSKQIFGPGRIGDNNGYAVFLAALLPFVFFSGRYLPLGGLNFLRGPTTLALVFGNAIAIVLTYSRGGFLASTAVILLLLGNLRSAMGRTIGWGIILPALILSSWTVFTADPSFIELPESHSTESKAEQIINGYVARLRTLRTELESEESASGRLHFWKVAFVMAQANPAFGVGINQFSQRFDEFDFSSGQFGAARAVHSTFMLVLSELGFIGFSVYSWIVLGVLLSLWRSRRRLRLVRSGIQLS